MFTSLKIFITCLLHMFTQIHNEPMVALTLRSLTLYIYGAPILDVSRSHTMTQYSR